MTPPNFNNSRTTPGRFCESHKLTSAPFKLILHKTLFGIEPRDRDLTVTCGVWGGGGDAIPVDSYARNLIDEPPNDYVGGTGWYVYPYHDNNNKKNNNYNYESTTEYGQATTAEEESTVQGESTKAREEDGGMRSQCL